MFDLKCKREGCTYNKNCRCSAKHITIEKVANCQSYTPSEDYKKTEKSTITQKALRTNTIVDCKVAGCLFNHGGSCIANGITVATKTNTNEPECLTIKQK